MLDKLPEDVFQAVCVYLGLAALSKLDCVRRVHEKAWTNVVQQRCGPLWLAGKAGFYRFQHALLWSIPKPYGFYTQGNIRAQSAVVLHAAGLSQKLEILCAAALPGGQVVVGTERGIVLYDGNVRLSICSSMSVVDVTSLGGTLIAFCTREHRAYTCDVIVGDIDMVKCGMYAFCVSGPVLAVGGDGGVWPFCVDRAQSCLRIEQSATLVACWHLSGYVSLYGAQHGRALHAFHTGWISYPCLMFSVVGDVVRVNGVLYCKGIAVGACENDERSTDMCGTSVWTRNKWRCGANVYS